MVMRENTAVISRNVTSTVKMSIIGTSSSSTGFFGRLRCPVRNGLTSMVDPYAARAGSMRAACTLAVARLVNAFRNLIAAVSSPSIS